jgi:holo-[acyl-carrier protein] synthase
MIVGIGVDIIEISRISKALHRNDKFLEKVFTELEIKYLQERKLRPQFAAARFAAKEAVSKALGTGFRGFGFRDIEIDRTELGKPIVNLKGKAKEIAESFGSFNIHLSISHGEDNAIAYAVLEVQEAKGGEE